MTARDAILARVDRAAAAGRVPGVPVGAAPPDERDRHDVLARFVRELRALGVEVFVEASDGDVRARVQAHVSGHRTVSWAAARLPYGTATVVSDGIPWDAAYADQASADVGLTGCDAAIADTGSLVLLSGPGAPRSTSLLPPVHVAIVRRDDIVSTAAEVFSHAADRMAQSACCTFITGPSRTADIELSLTIGVHGPGRLVVVVGP
ncbi:MAG TPA: lactate utilization protein [Vicinamibacterales bacterium]|jgi:L-lactate dehydrogenase complex protein LldG|nr:lactate utilization protein [Vicinamibacterales bacterium]